jgi:hypothetical protein
VLSSSLFLFLCHFLSIFSSLHLFIPSYNYLHRYLSLSLNFSLGSFYSSSSLFFISLPLFLLISQPLYLSTYFRPLLSLFNFSLCMSLSLGSFCCSSSLLHTITQTHHYHCTTTPHTITSHKNTTITAPPPQFGEMGDKIALQYGGSEAHNKVLAGKAVATATKPKHHQNELLTSIKRYYSNAFTDMVKQDAMNVFLGCFVPSQQSQYLWDLESDYDLHNKDLRPNAPLVHKVLFEELARDNSMLLSTPLLKSAESSIKRAFAQILVSPSHRATESRTNSLPNHTQASSSRSESPSKMPTATAIALEATLDQPLVSSPSATAKLVDLIGDLTMSEAREHIESMTLASRASEASAPTSMYDSSSEPNSVLKRLLAQYFVRNYKAGSNSNTDGKTSNRVLIEGFASKSSMSKIIRGLARFEQRKLIRISAAKKIRPLSQMWWKSALKDYEETLYGPVGSEDRKDKDNGKDRELDLEIDPSALSSKSQQSSPGVPRSYFDRIYQVGAMSV